VILAIMRAVTRDRLDRLLWTAVYFATVLGCAWLALHPPHWQ
jgi:hypothetical protein